MDRRGARRRHTAKALASSRRDRTALLTGAGVVLVLLALAAGYRTMLGPGPADAIGGPFRLVDADGHPRSDISFRGRYMLIFFGYTGCTDICPRTLTEMSEALDRVDPDARRIQPLFITVDPARDTPAMLRRYTAGFSSHLIGLTGTTGQLDAVQRRFHVVVAAGSGPGRVDHSAVLYLLGPGGNFVVPIPADADRSTMQDALLRYAPGPISG